MKPRIGHIYVKKRKKPRIGHIYPLVKDIGCKGKAKDQDR